MVLAFPVMAEYALLPVGKRLMFVTHGHIFNNNHLPPLCKGDILLHGHTHVPACDVHEDYVYLNPGSVAIPKDNSPHGYMTLEGETFYWKTMDGEITNTYQ